MATTCSKPTCAEPAAAWLSIAPNQQLATLHDEPIDAAMPLCAGHRDRFTVPMGWRLVVGDERRHRGPWFATDVEIDEDFDPGPEPEPGSLLSRALHGPEVVAPDVLEARRLARRERVEPEVDGTPDGLGEGVEQDRHDDRDAYADGHDRADGDVGEGQDRTDDDDPEDEPEGDDGIDTYGTDELPFPPLESKATARAAIG